MTVNPTLSEKIEATLKDFLDNPEPFSLNFDEPIDLKKFAAQLNVLPISINFSSCYGIRPDGEVVVLDFNQNNVYTLVELESHSAPRIRRIILFKAAKKYAELNELMPRRPIDAVKCNSCKGTGVEPINEKLGFDEERIVCWCGGLGWLPKDEKH